MSNNNIQPPFLFDDEYDDEDNDGGVDYKAEHGFLHNIIVWCFIIIACGIVFYAAQALPTVIDTVRGTPAQ